jgi:Lipocalin-like domain
MTARSKKVRLPLSIAILLFALHGVGEIRAQQRVPKARLVGYWTLISVDNVKPDGSRAPRHGAHPAGLLIFDAKGHYSLIVLTEGTPEEYKTALEGNNADYGHYTVNESDQSITFFMEHASHPELEGSSHTRYFTLKGDRLTYTTVRPDSNQRIPITFGEVVLEKMK